MDELRNTWFLGLKIARGTLFARLENLYNRLAIFWPWADKVLISLTFMISAFRMYGYGTLTLNFNLVLTFIFLVLVFRSPLLKSPPPPLSGFIGMLLSYQALAFLQFPSEDYSISSQYVTIFLVVAILFYVVNLAWSLYTIGRSFAIFPSARLLVTSGPYTIVRHPIYSIYLHFAMCITLVTPTLRNFVVTSILATGLFLRTQCEEDFLERGQAYDTFRTKVKNRFFSPAYSAPLALLAAAVLASTL
jgi:protein-S-isoprenylcysteine O-methyltransferase Ste14